MKEDSAFYLEHKFLFQSEQISKQEQTAEEEFKARQDQVMREIEEQIWDEESRDNVT